MREPVRRSKSSWRAVIWVYAEFSILKELVLVRPHGTDHCCGPMVGIYNRIRRNESSKGEGDALFLSIIVAVCLAAASSTAHSAQTPDKFILGCTLPFDNISVHRPLDTSCENEGRPKPEDGALEANKEQNRAKNNLCAGG